MEKKEECIILIEENGDKYVLVLENEQDKNKALKIILDNDIVLFGYSMDISQEEFEEYKNNGYTILELQSNYTYKQIQ
jgi:aspartate-semialdehyde dehydrogenase